MAQTADKVRQDKIYLPPTKENLLYSPFKVVSGTINIAGPAAISRWQRHVKTEVLCSCLSTQAGGEIPFVLWMRRVETRRGVQGEASAAAPAGITGTVKARETDFAATSPEWDFFYPPTPATSWRGTSPQRSLFRTACLGLWVPHDHVFRAEFRFRLLFSVSFCSLQAWQKIKHHLSFFFWLTSF